MKQTAYILLKCIVFSLGEEDANNEANEENHHSQRQNDGDDHHGSAAPFKTTVYLLVSKSWEERQDILQSCIM